MRKSKRASVRERDRDTEREREREAVDLRCQISSHHNIPPYIHHRYIYIYILYSKFFLPTSAVE